MNHTRLHEAFPILPGLRVRAVIDTDALIDNYHALLDPVRAVAPHTCPIAVVKADAYGHGIRPVVSTLLEEGCRAFAVACLEEAVALRRLLRELMPHEDSDRDTDILVLGYTDPENAAILAEYGIMTTLISEDYTDRLLACAERDRVTIRVHVALDTGMNRIGFPAHDDKEIAETVETLASMFNREDPAYGLIVDGLFTHFARADEDYDTEMNNTDSLTMTQYARYRKVLDGLTARGITPRVCHVCNSAAAIRFPYALPEGCMDAVRLGISLYGYGVDFPQDSETTFPSGRTRPIMRLETVVTHIHTLCPGETVGYGGTYFADTPRTLATLPVGYADGWIRDFSGATVTFRTPTGDVTAPIVGRICMDQCMADVTDLPVTVGTPVTLFGQDPAELEALAERAGTITYELLCLITARIPRVY